MLALCKIRVKYQEFPPLWGGNSDVKINFPRLHAFR